MALFSRDDAAHDGSVRMTGFDRCRQVLSLYTFGWMKVNLLTVLGSLPLAAGITISLLTSSLLLLIPLSMLGGLILGPFLACMVDAVLRGLRDAPGHWWRSFCKSFRQNLTDSLLPGAFTGLIIGLYTFMLYVMFTAKTLPNGPTLLMSALSMLLVLMLETLYWPQLVLFRLPAAVRLTNSILFSAKYLWRVLLAAILQAVWIAILVLYAPWTLILIPFLGWWLLVFLAQFTIYQYLDEEFQVESRLTESARHREEEPQE